jgi:outer membrane protein assembly factor BamB
MGIHLVLFLSLVGLTGAEESYSVGSRGLGMVGGALEQSEFIKLLGKSGVKAAPGKVGAQWWKPGAGPAGKKPLVTLILGLGEQAEAYAFDFSGPDGALVRAVHIPYRKTYIPLSRSYRWIAPTSGLAAAFQGALEKPLGEARTSLRLTVSEWKADAEEEQGGGGIEEMSAGMGINNLQALSYKQGGPILTAMAWWAAWANEWRPTHGEGQDRAHLQVRMKYKSVDLRLTLKTAAGEYSALQRNVPEEWIQTTLVRMFWSVRNPGAIHDLGRAAVGPVSPIAASGKRFVFVHRGVLQGFDPVTGKRIYPPVPEPGSKPPARAPRPITYERIGEKLYRTSSRFAAVKPVDGSESVLASARAGKPWMVSLGEGREVALAAAWNAKLFRGAKPVWDQKLHRAITAGPLIGGDAVILGTGEGRVTALKKADGSPLWTASLPGTVYGPIVRSGDLALVFCNEDESLHALGLADGKPRWKVAVGDRLRGRPWHCGNSIFLASKANRFLLIDPASGKVKGTKEWSSWLLDVSVVSRGDKPLIVCTDLEDRVSLLNGETLAVVFQKTMPAPLTGRTVLADAVPLRWAAASGKDAELGGGSDVESGPALIVGDRDGYFYLVAVPEGQ